jgi:multiple sugar transport system permease protein
MPHTSISNKTKNRLYTLLFLAPWIITLLVFWLYPLGYSLYLSLSDYNSFTGEAVWVGLDNYIRMFGDENFLQALGNTVFFTVGTVPVTVALAVILAALINSKTTRFQSFFRATYFLPSVTSLVVVALVFTNLYSGNGYINTLLQALGLPYPEGSWLLDPDLALLSIMAMDVWMAIGYYMILFIAGMQSISPDLYDAAELAGASKFRQFISITLPLLKPTFAFVIIVNTIKSFQVFIEILIMTKGGPLGTTSTIVYQIYEEAFTHIGQMGYASAMAYFLFAVLIIFSVVQSKLLKVD